MRNPNTAKKKLSLRIEVKGNFIHLHSCNFNKTKVESYFWCEKREEKYLCGDYLLGKRNITNMMQVLCTSIERKLPGITLSVFNIEQALGTF